MPIPFIYYAPATAETLGSTIRPIHSLLIVEEIPFIDSTNDSAVKATTYQADGQCGHSDVSNVVILTAVTMTMRPSVIVQLS
jgi:hypothetical protein